MNYKMIVTILMIILVVVFTVQNAAVVTVTFLVWNIEISRALLIFLVLFIGIIIGWLSRSHVKRSK